MVLRLMLIFCIALSVSCTNIRDGNFQVALSVKEAKLYSKNTRDSADKINFCEEIEVESSIYLKVRFDCSLLKDEIRLYKIAFLRYHELVVEKFNSSLISKFFSIDKPLNVHIVNKNSKFFFKEDLKTSISIYIPSLDEFYLDEVLSNFKIHGYDLEFSFSNEIIKSDSDAFDAFFKRELLYEKIVAQVYPLIVHEYFHYKSLVLSDKEDAPFQDLWVNEYLAFSLSHFMEMTIFNTLGFNFVSEILLEPRLPVFNMDYDLENQVKEFCHNRKNFYLKSKFFLSNNKNEKRSKAGRLLYRSMYKDIFHNNHLLSIYILNELESLSNSGSDLNSLLARIPACNEGMFLNGHIFKYQILDYDFNEFANNVAFENNSWIVNHQNISSLHFQDPEIQENFFSICFENDDELFQRYCTGAAIDYFVWKKYELAKNSKFNKGQLSSNFLELSERYSSLLKDFELVKQAEVKVKHGEYYVLSANGRFQNHQGHIADTAASVNVWPQGTDCNLQGQQTVKNLASKYLTLTRCTLDPSIGVIWKNEEQVEKVIGVSTLVAQNATLIRDKVAMTRYRSVPYLFRNGFIVFQLMDNDVRLNLCLDSGSPQTYITRRYKERYQYTNRFLASKLEIGQISSKFQRQLIIPIFGADRQVRLLPNNDFLHCDLIVGSDLLGMFGAIEIGKNHLRLWE